ncbi:MAG: hypothetical protein JSS83_26850 [Cyanobacteria bacterium SZAS LIN-3]|nr:hypothetical protein [Cyanobacteria bacterium SZAS LIN-3]MBS2006828.1 hypothetical protein [Cyanobacteria bacterium SZAS TMP-1]
MTSVQRFSAAWKDWSFRLPVEHGAVLAFALACIVSLLTCRAHPLSIAGAEIILWSMMLSLHRRGQLMRITALAVAALLFCSQAAVAAWIVLVWVGSQVTAAPSRPLAPWCRETVGLAGSTLAPIMTSCLICGNPGLHLTISLTMMGAVITGTALIRASHRESLVTPLPAVLISLCLWLWLAIISPVTAVWCLVPYVAQSLWLLIVPKPSFKLLGQVQSVCLLWVAVSATFNILGIP